MSPDGELCDTTSCRLEQQGEEPADELYTTIVLAWSARGAIGDGGFEHLFEGAFFQRDPRYERTLAAFERIGARACADALREALAWLGSPPPADQAARMARVLVVPEDERWRIASSFRAGQPELERQLAAYVRAHAAELEARPPAEHRLGDLRLAGPLLEQLREGEVVAAYDLTEWSAGVGAARQHPAVVLAALASLAFVALGALRGWPWLAAAALAAVVAARTFRSRLCVVLRRGATETRVGGWAPDDPRALSFVSSIVSTARPGGDPDGDDGGDAVDGDEA